IARIAMPAATASVPAASAVSHSTARRGFMASQAATQIAPKAVGIWLERNPSVNKIGTLNHAANDRQRTASSVPIATARNISSMKKNECWSVNGGPVGG